MKTESFTPRIDSIHRIQEFVAGFVSAEHADPEKQVNIELVIEEIVSNIINYGFDNGSAGEIEVGVDIQGSDICITISDNGMPFNPLETEDPKLDADLDGREVGGLGIFFVKQLVKDARYAWKQGKNHLFLIV